jgi:predicted RNA-binding Zn-ribbon protein involved in translation (DUF1610 family)
MNYELIRRNGDFPPGNYRFTDPRTGMTFDGNGGFDFTVHAIAMHRKANPNLYPPADLKMLDQDAIAQQLEQFTCARLNNSSQWCKRSDGVVIMKIKEPGEKVKLKVACPNCGGTEATEKLCSTCSGRRVTGYVCNQCGFLLPV